MNYKYYPMHMHLHAGCDYGSSMALDKIRTSRNSNELKFENFKKSLKAH